MSKKEHARDVLAQSLARSDEREAKRSEREQQDRAQALFERRLHDCAHANGFSPSTRWAGSGPDRIDNSELPDFDLQRRIACGHKLEPEHIELWSRLAAREWADLAEALVATNRAARTCGIDSDSIAASVPALRELDELAMGASGHEVARFVHYAMIELVEAAEGHGVSVPPDEVEDAAQLLQEALVHNLVFASHWPLYFVGLDRQLRNPDASAVHGASLDAGVDDANGGRREPSPLFVTRRRLAQVKHMTESAIRMGLTRQSLKWPPTIKHKTGSLVHANAGWFIDDLVAGGVLDEREKAELRADPGYSK
jgi:hypothetical protein